MSITQEPYGFDPLFERAIAYLAASDHAFWARIGKHLEPSCVGAGPARLILEGCRHVARSDGGRGPGSILVLLQRLSRLCADGKIRQDVLQEVGEYLDAAEDYGLPPVDACVSELVPVIRRRMHAAVAEQSAAQFASRGDFKKVREQLDAADKVGTAQDAIETSDLEDGFGAIASVGSLQRLPTGIIELDLQLLGLPRKSMGVFLGGSGDGKSQALMSQGAQGVISGLHVGVVTLELPRHIQLARLYGNLTGVEVDLILDNEGWRQEAIRRMQQMAPYVGVCGVVDMPPHATTTKDILEWIDSREQKVGRKMELLIVDYGDKMAAPEMHGRQDNTYLEMRHVYEGMRRDIAVARDMWLWTASQGSRPSKDQGKRLDLKDVADSMHKVRVADWVITLNAKEGEMLLYVAKNRIGKSRFEVGPLPTDFARGRFTPRAREWAQW